MKYLIIIFSLIGLNTFACESEALCQTMIFKYGWEKL